MTTNMTISNDNVNDLLGKTIRAFDKDGWCEGVVVQVQGIFGIRIEKTTGERVTLAHYNVKEVRA